MDLEHIQSKNELFGQVTGEIVLYQPDDVVRLEVRLEEETVWLTQSQMVILFGRDRTVITKHVNNIFKEGELDEKSNVQFLHIANSDKPVKVYNLDAIISVGYRVKSQRGTDFRIWARGILKEYLLKGIVVNQRIERLENKIEKFDLLLKSSQQQNELLLNEIQRLRHDVESILADFNDINKDTRMQLELICEEIAKLQAGMNFGLN